MTPLSGTKAGIWNTPEGRLRLGWRLLLFLFSFVLFFLFFPLVFVVAGMAIAPGPVWAVLALLVAGVAAGWLLLALEDRPFGALGFHLSLRAPLEVGKGIVLGVIVAGSAVLAMALLGGVRWTVEGAAPGSVLAAAVSAFAVFLVPAAAEEAIFRGYPFQALAEAWGPVIALCVTSVGFGLAHLLNPSISWISILNLVAAGFLLGVVYLRTLSLWWASGVHLGWNWTLGFLADLPVSGLEVVDNPLVEGVAGSPDWLSGGAFGPEGSIVMFGTVVTATAILWWRGSLAPGDAARASRALTPLPAAGGRASPSIS